MNDTLQLGSLTLTSRLLLGTGKYADLEVMREAFSVTGVDMVTVAIRRVNLGQTTEPTLLDYIDTAKIFLLPNTVARGAAALRERLKEKSGEREVAWQVQTVAPGQEAEGMAGELSAAED